MDDPQAWMEVCVKNTFIDLHDPAVPELRRVKTAPERPIEEEAEEPPESESFQPNVVPQHGDAVAEEPEAGRGLPARMSRFTVAACRLPLETRVIVKNTFLDIDDDSPVPEELLRRVKTEPCPKPVDFDFEDSPGDDNSSTGPTEATEPESMTYRTVTCDSVEPYTEWDWGNSNALKLRRQACPEEPAAPVRPAVPVVAQPVTGFVMVPSTLLMPGVVGIRPVDSMPRGCVAVPVDRHARWPGGLPLVAPPMQAPPVLSRVKTPDQPPAAAPDFLGTGAPEVLPSAPLVSPRPQAPEQPVLQRAFSIESAIFRVNWTVAARKLKSKDQFAVSPKFELSFQTPAEFKLVIHPTKISDQKGGKSFVAAKGKGRVELKCETQLDTAREATMTYRISVGAGSKRLLPRGPVTHNFAESSVSGLPADEEEWDFPAVVEEDAQTFVICLEILPVGK